MLGLTVTELTGDTTPDLRAMERSDIVLATPERWDALSRRWQQRKVITRVTLFIVDEMHLIGSDVGPTIEVSSGVPCVILRVPVYVCCRGTLARG